MTDLTPLLSALGPGDPHAASRLLPLASEKILRACPDEEPSG